MRINATLVDALARECVPEVTRVGSISETVGDRVFYVPTENPEMTALVIEQAMKSPLGPRARQRIKERFPLARRALGLVEVVESLFT